MRKAYMRSDSQVLGSTRFKTGTCPCLGRLGFLKSSLGESAASQPSLGSVDHRRPDCCRGGEACMLCMSGSLR